MIEISLPIRLQSPNVKEHWTKTHKRNKRIAKPVRDQVCGHFFDLAPGQADCQKCFDIHYLQEKGGSGIKILLEFFDKNGEIL